MFFAVFAMPIEIWVLMEEFPLLDKKARAFSMIPFLTKITSNHLLRSFDSSIADAFHFALFVRIVGI
jgi:hypothetical protein